MAIPAAQRGEQLASTGGKDGLTYRQSEKLDALVDGMQRGMLAGHNSEVHVMRGLNARSLLRMTFSPEETMLRAERVSIEVAQLVLESDWREEQKYAFALLNRESARLWAQMIALIPDLPLVTLNRLASLSYTTDEYIWDEDILRIARISGALTRWIARRPVRLQEQLACALRFLEDAPPGTKITLTNGRRAEDACVEIMFPGQDMAAAIAS